MKKRLRKKLHRGEFQEFGFALQMSLQPDLTIETRNELVDYFIEMIENQNLMYGGGLTEGFITAERGSVTDGHQQAIEAWINAQKEKILTFTILKKDAWRS